MNTAYENEGKRLLHEYADNFDSAQARIDGDYRASPHYAAVARIGEPVYSALVELMATMRQLDGAQLYTDPKLLHITLANTEIEDGYEHLHRLVEEYLARKPKFNVIGVIMGGAFVVGAWPQDIQLLKGLRASVVAAYGRMKDHRLGDDSRNSHGWITVARFVQPPNEALVSYARSMVEHDFGEMILERATIYKPKFRTLQNSETIVKVA